MARAVRSSDAKCRTARGNAIANQGEKKVMMRTEAGQARRTIADATKPLSRQQDGSRAEETGSCPTTRMHTTSTRRQVGMTPRERSGRKTTLCCIGRSNKIWLRYRRLCRGRRWQPRVWSTFPKLGEIGRDLSLWPEVAPKWHSSPASVEIDARLLDRGPNSAEIPRHRPGATVGP